MSKRIKDIVNYFFHHRVSDGLTKKVHQRMLTADEEQTEVMEEVMSQLWDEQEAATCPAKEVEQALHRVEGRLNFSPRKLRMQWWRVAAVWLVPLLALGGSLFYYQRAARMVSDGKSSITYKEHYASVGTRERVILPDSSEVWLNAGSLLIYPSDFCERRNVYLMGEGYFEVRKDEQHPFVVATRHLAVRVLGTTFNLNVYPESEQLMATLESGSVNVTILSSQKEYILRPNEQLVYTPATQDVQCHRVNAANFSEWRMGGLFFNDMTLGDVLEALERTYDVKMHLNNSAYQSQRIRVWFNRDESLDNVLRIIRALVPGINYTINNKEVYWK